MANPSILVNIINQNSGVREGMPGTVQLIIGYTLSDIILLPDTTPVIGRNPDGSSTGGPFLDREIEACINATLTDTELRTAAANASIADANAIIAAQGGLTVFTSADVRMPG